MSESDASFADGAPLPASKIRLMAHSDDDLAIVSALMQDAVGKTSEIAWIPKKRIFAMVLNRFRWEDAESARRDARPYQRIRCGLHVENVLSSQFRGFDAGKAQQAFAVLGLRFEPAGDGTGKVFIDCAGDASFALSVEALDVRMADMDTVWTTPTLPGHGDPA